MAHAASQADRPVSGPSRPVLQLDRLDAVVFDTDGVLTDTASVHAAAWKQLFDGYLEERAARLGEPFQPFTEADYLRHVDGRPRYDGVAAFLASRGVDLEGEQQTKTRTALEFFAQNLGV